MIAYFDRNVFGHISARQAGIDDSVVGCLEAHIRDGRLRIPLSMVVLDEVVGALENTPEVVQEAPRSILALTSWRLCVKMPGQILREATSSYAQSRGVPSPYFPLSRTQQQELTKLREGQPSRFNLPRVFLGSLAKKQQFLSFLKDCQRLAVIDVRKDQGWQEIEPIELWPKLAPDQARRFANNAGVLRACERRGLPGLLKMKPVRAATGMLVALMHNQAIKGVRPTGSDYADLQHVVMAAASSDVFVTHDKRLRGRIASVPIGLETASLLDLLHMLERGA